MVRTLTTSAGRLTPTTFRRFVPPSLEVAGTSLIALLWLVEDDPFAFKLASDQTANGGGGFVCRLNVWRKSSLYTRVVRGTLAEMLAKQKTPL